VYGNGGGNPAPCGGTSVANPIPRKDLKTAQERFDTRRAQYLYLSSLGYSQERIAATYEVSKRAIWQAIHASTLPKEKGKLDRFRVKYQFDRRKQ
jgi:predicted DNA-binding protein YlxM (UPF0122 family)